MPVKLNSPDWSIEEAGSPRGSGSAATKDIPSFPSEFLTEYSEVAEEFVARPKPAIRGATERSGALDFSYDLAADEASILAIRYPSGALTFHLPVQSTSRSIKQPNQVRFAITVRSTDEVSGTRGIASKAVKVILIKVGKVLADKAVSLVLPKVAESFENHTWNKRGLQEGWLHVTKETLGEKRLAPGKPISTERSLLLIHGTFSNTVSAYGPLADSNFFERVKTLYGDRIFGFDHFTVCRTPAQNAKMLLEELPEQMTIFDVITHSRGGLVLRNLVERAQMFGPVSNHFKLGRAILVASPNLGTPLATPQRWGDTVGWLANLLEIFPENPFTTGAAFVANGLVWLARHASGDLPGLHCMDSAGELISALENAPAPSADAYSALAANYYPTKEVLLRMLDTGIDQFFGSANDLVVPSEGGWRVAPGRALAPAARIGCFGPGGNLSGDSVTHVSFFSRPETVDFLTLALSGLPQPLKRFDSLAALPDHRLLREGKATLASTEAEISGAKLEHPRVGAGRVSSVVQRPSVQLEITVINGDLTFEKEALLLGHYRATKLTGTEKIINDVIGGAMKRSLALGVYPLLPGSHQVFVNTQSDPAKLKRMPRPKAVIVVGLGEEGRLSAEDLALSVRQAVIGWAQRIIEQDRRAPATFDLSTTLLGSGGTGVTSGEAAQRIAQGVFEANELLSRQLKTDGQNYPRVRQLRLIEIYLDRATEAWRALKMQATATPDRYKICSEIQIGIGSLPRPLALGYRGVDYDFITAETQQEGNGTLIKYTLDTKRARSEVRAKKTQRQLLRDLVATASSAENQDNQIGRTLFQLLVPLEMEAVLAGTGEMQIELEPGTAGIPWELLDSGEADDRSRGKKPWAIRTKLLRKLRIQDYRVQVTDASLEANILVIGEPACPKNYPRLLGAREEAVAVYECLAGPNGVGSSRVKPLFSNESSKVGPDARSVINALLERPWRIAHIAGHGDFSTDGTTGGVVLSNGAFLGSNEIETMRAVPELVFVNCCHLAARDVDQLLAEEARQNYDRPRFASNVAEQLIKIGVKCVIAAGWAVDDIIARTFATTFYNALLSGSRFIDAVALAREASYDRGGNTWAAYQCYGDPDWIFRRDREESEHPSAVPVDDFSGIGSAEALKLALQTIIVQTKFQHFKAQVQLERLRWLEKQFAKTWGGIGSIAELFGASYLESRAIADALNWYQRAVDSEDGTASLKAVEQLANVKVRLAWETVDTARKHRDRMALGLQQTSKGRTTADSNARVAAKRSLAAAENSLKASITLARQSIEEGIAQLEKLASVRPTMERESLYGSACKRLALIEAVAGRTAEERRAIAIMKEHYQRASVIAREEQRSDASYPALNYLAAELVLNAGHPGWKGLDMSIVDWTQASLEAKSDADPDFWSVVGETELQLYKAVATGKLATSLDRLERGYNNLYKRVSAPWMWSSVYDATQFALEKYCERTSVKERKAAETLLVFLGRLTRRNED